MGTLNVETTTDGIVFFVKVRPGAGRSCIVGAGDGFLRLNVKAQPEGGKANRDVEKLISGALGLSRDGVRITSGKKSRRKRIRVKGIEKAVAEKKLMLGLR